jgi:hypothetical protein
MNYVHNIKNAIKIGYFWPNYTRFSEKKGILALEFSVI